ncbi:hypothetical protein LSH36_715g01051 [Paralvinella palmiformis]|uniref:Endonuclease/exonuclease/phosphatase domain-containing protein n=1 Tax=Paralvinella palmiformis TaxID=53620 RepID=A0AAD9MTL6_9ANNE|nr:hypothetical protein LSH36_715g01051 [Paralvinella palmiformis]
MFLANSFLPCISKLTRITDYSQTLIDNIYTNNIQQDTVIKSGILLEDSSDHLPIICSVSTKRRHQEKLKMKTIEQKKCYTTSSKTDKRTQALRLIKEHKL